MHTQQERERGARERKRDETFMTRRVGVGNHYENSKVNFSPGLWVMRVKTAWRHAREGKRGWGSQRVKIAPGCDEGRRQSLSLGF